MAHLVPHNNSKGFNGGGGFSNTVPAVIPSKFRGDPVEPENENVDEPKKTNRIVGDARVVNRAFSRLRIAQACNAYLGMIGLGI